MNKLQNILEKAARVPEKIQKKKRKESEEERRRKRKARLRSSVKKTKQASRKAYDKYGSQVKSRAYNITKRQLLR